MIWNGSSLLLAWEDFRSQTSTDIYAGRLTSSGTVGIAELGLLAASGLHIRMLSANPLAHGNAQVAVQLPDAARVDADVFDAQGRWVRRIDSEDHSAGTHILTWDGRDESGAREPSGIYFLRIEAGNRSSSVKLVRMK